MIRCSSHKKVYATKEIAEDALIEAHIQFAYANGSGPISVYQCEDCNYYHLSSKGQINNKLAEYLKEGKIQKQKEANWWTDKLKKK
jgi:hypothetical protein